MRYALRSRNFNKGKIQKHKTGRHRNIKRKDTETRNGKIQKEETASTHTYGYRRKIKNHHPFG